MLPEECVDYLLSYTSPWDVCRSSLVSKSFLTAERTDVLWESFLSTDVAEISEVAKFNGEQQNKRESRNNKKQNQSTYTMSFYKLFSFTDSINYVLILLGLLDAAGDGVSLPLMMVLFGNLIRCFGGASNGHDALHQVSKVALEFF
ncbi:hypothetical protein ZIOFF_056928 [Zingiber officinale]|uniref:F-box domain-containing protein n=1 Tax=Zingiber officinale TaxID=94328 RepID=A0A8J5FH75_ZINOF|nr:hypothetical protein ZIOFF_056928 [Zingiber officinale]